MPNQTKILEVANLVAKIADAKAVYLADYRGITVFQITQLRDKIREAGGELLVAKNTLSLRALRQAGYHPTEKEIAGPSMLLFANTDEVTPLKTLFTFAKTNNLMAIKIGYLNKTTMTAVEVTRLATLPGRPELQAKLVGLLASQPQKLVYSLKYNLNKLVFALTAIKSQKA